VFSIMWSLRRRLTCVCGVLDGFCKVRYVPQLTSIPHAFVYLGVHEYLSGKQDVQVKLPINKLIMSYVITT
jgi:hypothetical protein